MCPFNVFEASPDYIYSTFILLVLALEMLILKLQAKYGPRFFIPKSFRKGFYNYYRSLDEIKGIRKENDIETVCNIIITNYMIIIRCHVQFV